eukprot:TRINITY_DN13643_c0_g1_i1.p1 TRINITY_DN13643_c0_g1~~TRINITY_DN13643_c0_g1_i1.p1  ORF type:complete len:1388 (+),score=260.45 TRINITY_DN13643_c0_g1_i1:79-4242(+)
MLLRRLLIATLIVVVFSDISLEDEVVLLRKEVKQLKADAMKKTQAKYGAASEDELQWMFEPPQSDIDVRLSNRMPGPPMSGWRRIDAKTKAPGNETSSREVSVLSSGAAAAPPPPKASDYCFFYNRTECSQTDICTWEGIDGCRPAIIVCNTAAKARSQCLGANDEFAHECEWESSCHIKDPGAEHGSLCRCPPNEENPYHIHSKDVCQIKKLTHADGTVDETCYIVQTCGHHSHEHSPPYNVLLVTGSFGVGAFFRHWGPRIPVIKRLPYTVLIFSLGTGFGFATGFGYPLSNYDGLANMDPHEIFFIFLPILIFESAFATDYHVFKKVFVGCLLLAGPGLLVSAFLTGLLAKFAFTQYNWSWVSCFLFGTVLSATDPVAVVALLKELGASVSISTMIEGESLFNDGTAIALFNILKDAVPTGEIELSAPEMFIEFVKIALGGPSIGFIVGMLVKYCLEGVFNDQLIEVSVTVSAAYVTFFVAEGFLGVSGVLGLVAFGCYLSYHKQCISPEVEHTMHHFWEIVVFMTNTLIFALAGLIVSKKAFEGIGGIDYAYLMITYAGVNCIRGFGLFMFMPVLSRLPYQLDWRNALLVTWGGLRGAVGLALGLIVAGDSAILCSHPELGSRFLFHCSGIVVLTLLVNGVTTQPIVARLGLDQIAETKRLNMLKAHQKLIANTEKDIRGLMRRPVLADTNWQKLRELVFNGLDNPYAGDSREIVPPEDNIACVDAYCKLLLQSVLHQYEEGNLGGMSSRKLTALCTNASDESRYLYGSDLEEEFQMAWYFQALNTGASVFPVVRSRLATYSKKKTWAEAFDLTIGFVTAHEACIKNVNKLLDKKLAVNVTRHCKKEILEAMRLLDWYTKEMPEVAVAIKTRHASREVLNLARAHCHHMEHEGMIDENDTHELVHQVERRMESLNINLKAAEKPSEVLAILSDFKWFNTSGSQQHLHRRFTVEKFEKGNTIGEKGLLAEGFYCVTLGVVRVHIAGKAQYFGPGFCCHLHSTLCGNNNSPRFSEVFAETAVVAAFFAAASVDEAVTVKETEEALWLQAGVQVSEHVLSSTHPYALWDDTRIREMCHTAELSKEITADGKTHHNLSSHIAILLNGRCSEVPKSSEHKPEIIKEPMKLDEIVSRSCLFWGDAVVVTIYDIFSASEKAKRLWKKLHSWIKTTRTIAGLIGPEAVRNALALALKRPLPNAESQGSVTDPNTLDWQKQYEMHLYRPNQHLNPKIGPGSPLGRRTNLRKFDAPPLTPQPSQPSIVTNSGGEEAENQKRRERRREKKRAKAERKEERRQERAKRASSQSTTADYEMSELLNHSPYQGYYEQPQGSPYTASPNVYNSPSYATYAPYNSYHTPQASPQGPAPPLSIAPGGSPYAPQPPQQTTT